MITESFIADLRREADLIPEIIIEGLEGIVVPTELQLGRKLPCMEWCQGTMGTEQQVAIIHAAGNDIEKTRRAMDVCFQQGVSCKCQKCSSQLLTLSEALSFHVALLEARGRKDWDAMTKAAERRGLAYKKLGHTAV